MRDIDTELIVQSFAYMAKQIVKTSTALSATAQYDQILHEAEKHLAALRLAQRDLAEAAWLDRRLQQHSSNDIRFRQERTSQRIANAQQAILRIAAQYAPHKLAA